MYICVRVLPFVCGARVSLPSSLDDLGRLAELGGRRVLWDGQEK